MDNMVIIALLGLFGTIGGGMIGAFVTIKTQRPISEANAQKAKAEAEEIEARIRRDMLTRNDEDMKRMQQEIDNLRHDFKIVISFARVHYEGSRKLYEQVVKINVEPPVFVPAAQFVTGELKAAT